MFNRVGEKFGFFVKLLFWISLIFTTVVFGVGIYYMIDYKFYIEYAGISFGTLLVLWILIYVLSVLGDYVFTLRRLCIADITKKTDKIHETLSKTTTTSINAIESNPNIKYCRYCGSVIPLDAVVCPECQKELV